MLNLNAGATPSRSNSAKRQRRWMLHGRIPALALCLSLLSLLMTACGVTTTPGAKTSPTASPSSLTAKAFFTRHPDSDNTPTKVFAVTRALPATATTLQAQATYALEQMFAGPTQAERAQGYYSPFDGQLALQSLCPGEFRTFDLTLDHRGNTPEHGTATFQFCRRVDIPGDLAGPRMSTMVASTLRQFPAITKVVVLNNQGACFDDLQGANACLNGTSSEQNGYPVKVYFSKHPDSDAIPAKVFPVARTSPTLGVATYTMSQLLAGPTPAEKAQGYYTPLEGSLTGASTCNGSDFTITLDVNRGHPESGTATLKICRDLPGFGDTGAAIVRNEIVNSLTQFATIHKVVITNHDDSCFDDLVGCQ